MISLAESTNFELATTSDVQEAVKNAETETQIGQILVAAYPGHQWHIEADKKAGIAKIMNLAMSTGPTARPWGFVLHLNKISSWSEMAHLCVMAGGEILERYGQARGKLDADAVDSGKQDFRGELIGDLA